MIRVAIILPEYLPVPAVEGGGVETLIDDFIKQNEYHGNIKFYVYSLYSHEAKLKSEEYRYSSFFFNKFKPEKMSNIFQRVARKLFKQTFIFNRKYFIPILHRVISEEYDYVILENKTALLPLISKMIKNRKTKLLVHIHNFDQIKPNYKVNLSTQCAGVITVSNYVKENIQKRYPDIDTNKIKVIRNFSDISEIDDGGKFNRNFRKSEGISLSDKVILYAGRLVESKGVLELFEALRQIGKKNVSLLVIGSSWYGNNVLSDFEKKLHDEADNICGKIIFVGYVPHNEMSKYYSVSDICVFPSKAPETAGLVQLESMACKKMTIVSDSGGMPEYIGESGAIVSLGENFLENLRLELQKNIDLSNSELKLRGEELYEQSRRFSRQSSFKEFLKLLEEQW